MVISNQFLIRTVTCRQFPNLTFAPRKPVILDGNLALHCYHVTALLVYLIQGNNASLFLFLYFFQYNLKTTYFQGLRTFAILPRLYQLGDWLPSLIPAYFSPPIEGGESSLSLFYRTKEKARHLLMSCSFFGISLRGFSSLHCSLLLYTSWECSSEEEVYILIGVYRCKTVLGKQPATA